MLVGRADDAHARARRQQRDTVEVESSCRSMSAKPAMLARHGEQHMTRRATDQGHVAITSWPLAWDADGRCQFLSSS